eukprot:608084-Pleurochrysis_carterae.AAC.1
MVSGITSGWPPPPRNSTASANGLPACGVIVAPSPRTRNVDAQLPLRGPMVSTPSRTPSLADFNAVASHVSYLPPMAVSMFTSNAASPAGRLRTIVRPSVNQTAPSLPLNRDNAAHRFHSSRSIDSKATGGG